jgi:hypothetical protein
MSDEERFSSSEEEDLEAEGGASECITYELFYLPTLVDTYHHFHDLHK